MEKRADEQLWHAWNTGGRKSQDLRPLMLAYRPIIQNEVSRWSGSGLPKAALNAEAKTLAADAFRTFTPGKSQLGTHLTNRLKGLDRYVNTYRADVRLPVEKVHLANKVYRAKLDLESELGREATLDEISERSGIGKHSIGSLKRFSATLYSNAEMGGYNQPVREDITHAQIVTDFLHSDLSPMQQKVFEHLTGHQGAAILEPGAIAKKLNVSGARVSQLRNQIADKARKHQAAVNSLMD